MPLCLRQPKSSFATNHPDLILWNFCIEFGTINRPWQHFALRTWQRPRARESRTILGTPTKTLARRRGSTHASNHQRQNALVANERRSLRTEWPTILLWLQETPDATAKSLFEKLRLENPGQFSEGQLARCNAALANGARVMARQLVYAGCNKSGAETEIIGAHQGKTSDAEFDPAKSSSVNAGQGTPTGDKKTGDEGGDLV